MCVLRVPIGHVLFARSEATGHAAGCEGVCGGGWEWMWVCAYRIALVGGIIREVEWEKAVQDTRLWYHLGHL